MTPLGVVYFYVCAALALVGASSVVIAKNPIRGAMGLLLLIINIAGLFLALDAQFLAAVQLIVYAGAIVVLFLFVIMLLGPAAATPRDQRGIFVRAAGAAVFGLGGLLTIGAILRVMAKSHFVPALAPHDPGFGGIDAFGAILFADALIPFELSSALLMVAVVGAIAVAKGRQGVRSLSQAERESVQQAPGAAMPQDHSGVFSHEIHADVAQSEGAGTDANLKERPA